MQTDSDQQFRSHRAFLFGHQSLDALLQPFQGLRWPRSSQQSGPVNVTKRRNFFSPNLHFLRRVIERVQHKAVDVRSKLFGVLLGEKAGLVLVVDRAGHEDEKLQPVRLERLADLLVNLPQFTSAKLNG